MSDAKIHHGQQKSPYSNCTSDLFHLPYGSIAWAPLIYRTNWKIIEDVQNMAIRKITGAFYLIRNDAILHLTLLKTIEFEAKRAFSVFFQTTEVSRKFPSAKTRKNYQRTAISNAKKSYNFSTLKP